MIYCSGEDPNPVIFGYPDLTCNNGNILYIIYMYFLYFMHTFSAEPEWGKKFPEPHHW